MDDTSPLSRSVRHRKKSVRLGPGAVCRRCGETNPLVLQGSELILCAECRLGQTGKPTTERHHPAGRNNDGFAAPFPANPHAMLSDAQVDWPKETLRNPEHDFLRTLAAWLRFFADVFRYLSTQAVTWATTLESYSSYLATTLGPEWSANMNGGS